MTKLKGTILLGEGYNKTKAVFDCNLPKIESNINLGEIEKLQLQINNIKDTLEYNELDVDYSKVPFTIEFLEDGYFAISPNQDTVHIEYSTDGGITWEDGELINPIQLAINHNLLLDANFYDSWLGIPVEAGDLICLRGLGLFYQDYFEMSAYYTESSLGLKTDAKYRIFGNINTLFFDAFRDIDIEFLYNIVAVPLEKKYLSEYPDKVDFWNACSKEEKIAEIFFGYMLRTPVLELINMGVPIEELLKLILMNGSGTDITTLSSGGWANIASTKQLLDYVYWTICIDAPISESVAGLSKLLLQELIKYEVTKLNKNSQDIFYTEELLLFLLMRRDYSFTNVISTEPFPLEDLFQSAPNLISIKNLYLQESLSYLIPKISMLLAGMEGMPFFPSLNYSKAFMNNKSLLDGNCIFHLDLPMKVNGTDICIVASHASMFKGCTALRVVPKDLTAGLSKNEMFSGCTNLNYIKFTATNIEDYYLTDWVKGVSPTGTFVKAKGVDIPVGNSGIPEGWTVEDYISPEEQLKELQVSVDTNTEEIDILKNRIISTTYSELKDAVTNSTLTTGQYYRITDYVTTCNGTSAKVTDASTIDPENPVDGQSRSAGHLFDIIVRALSPNQLDENAVAVCNASETYYDSTFNGTVIKYSIENKYWSTEDGKGTIYYMKDHNDNECSYDFTNIEYYYAEDTTWYLTFNKDSSKVVILNTNTVLPFVIIYGHLESPNSISITGSLLEIYMYAGGINAVNIKGTITNFKVIAPTNKKAHTININGNCDTVLLLSLGLISTITLNGYNNNIAMNVAGNLTFCTFDGQHQNLDVKVLGANAYCGIFNLVGQSKNCSINVPRGAINCFFVRGYLWETVINAAVLNTLIDGTLSSSNITASELNKVNFNGLCDIVTINSSKGITHSNFDTVKNIEITGGNHTISQLTFMKNTLSIKLLPYNELAPSYIIFEPRVFNITIEGGALNITLTNVARNLHLKSSQESAIAADVTINGIRGVSAESLLEIPMDLVVKGGCKKDIYGDLSGRIFYTWEDNLVKKGYYINDNTDTEWKEIPTPEEPVEVPTIPDAVTTALSVATLDLTTRTTIATIATDETLAFTLVPAIQGEYRLVVVNSSEADITITMPTEENYQCLCGATLTIPAQTNIELIINVTDTLIYIRKG